MTKEAIAKAPSGRVSRVPVGLRQPLKVEGKLPGFHYRIVNDVDSRVEDYKAAGYEIVPASEVKIGENRVERTSSEGSIARFSVGGGVKAVLMRQKQDWYDEDQKAKQDYVKQTEQATVEDARNLSRSNGHYGRGVEISSSL